jgi:diguanylate cyclase (GGDEF)-like protein/PAS domain S-box-containing protein
MDAIISVDTEQRIVLFNRAAQYAFGYTAGDVLGKPLDILIPEESRQDHRRHVLHFGADGRTSRSMSSPATLTAVRSDGTSFPIEATISRSGEHLQRRYTVILRDVTLRQRTAGALVRSEERFRGLVSQSLIGIVIVEEGRFSYANPKFAEMFGYNSEEIYDLSPVDMAVESDRELVAEQVRRRLSGEISRIEYRFRGLRKNGDVIDIECHSSVMEVSGKRSLISHLLDITERTRAERKVQELQDQLREQAIHDPLTGLYNRQPLDEIFDRELSLAARRHHPVSAVLGDLDHFKRVNDTYGHLAGDEILKMFGKIMKTVYRESDISCRYGGEEFLLLLPDVENATACARTEQLRAAVEATPVVFGGLTIHVTASFGVATFPQHGRTRDALIAAADAALYAAKHAGRNQVKGYAE